MSEQKYQAVVPHPDGGCVIVQFEAYQDPEECIKDGDLVYTDVAEAVAAAHSIFGHQVNIHPDLFGAFIGGRRV